MIPDLLSPNALICSPLRFSIRISGSLLGQEGTSFTIEPSFGVVLILPVVEGHSIVLVEVKRPVLDDMHSLEIPAGGLEKGETPQGGALRVI